MEQRRQHDEATKEILRTAANKSTVGQALLRLITQHDLPLSMVEWPELHTFVNALNY